MILIPLSFVLFFIFSYFTRKLGTQTIFPFFPHFFSASPKIKNRDKNRDTFYISYFSTSFYISFQILVTSTPRISPELPNVANHNVHETLTKNWKFSSAV